MTAARTAATVLAFAATALLGDAAEAQSTARTVRIDSQGIGLRTFAVLLPTAYDQSKKRYPVLYLLHGGGQDHTAYMARREFAKRARTVEMIVVMPAADRGAMPASAVTQYEDFITRELVGYVDSNYRTTATPDARAIAGLSMGGMIATGAGLRYPQVFGIVGAFSPAASRSAAPSGAGDPAQYFYVSCGTLDSLLPVSRQLAAVLEARGTPHEYHEISGLGHEWRFWDPQIDAFFRTLLTRPGWRSPAGPGNIPFGR
jgi:enterochelin esterase-like enzyme